MSRKLAQAVLNLETKEMAKDIYAYYGMSRGGFLRWNSKSDKK